MYYANGVQIAIGNGSFRYFNKMVQSKAMYSGFK